MKHLFAASLSIALLSSFASSAFATQEKDRQGECNIQIAYTGNTSSGFSVLNMNGYKLVPLQSDPNDPNYQQSNTEQRFQPLTIDIGGGLNLRFVVDVTAYNLADRRILLISAFDGNPEPAGTLHLITASSKMFTSKKDPKQESLEGFLNPSEGVVQLDNPVAVKLAQGKPVLDAFSGPRKDLPPGLLFVTAQIGCGTHVEPDLSKLK